MTSEEKSDKRWLFDEEIDNEADVACWWADEPVPFTVEDPRTVEVKIYGAAR